MERKCRICMLLLMLGMFCVFVAGCSSDKEQIKKYDDATNNRVNNMVQQQKEAHKYFKKLEQQQNQQDKNEQQKKSAAHQVAKQFAKGFLEKDWKSLHGILSGSNDVQANERLVDDLGLMSDAIWSGIFANYGNKTQVNFQIIRMKVYDKQAFFQIEIKAKENQSDVPDYTTDDIMMQQGNDGQWIVDGVSALSGIRK